MILLPFDDGAFAIVSATVAVVDAITTDGEGAAVVVSGDIMDVGGAAASDV